MFFENSNRSIRVCKSRVWQAEKRIIKAWFSVVSVEIKYV